MAVANVFTWGRIDLARFNIACGPIVFALLVTTWILATSTIDHVHWEANYITGKRIDLELAIERKRLHAVNLDLPTDARRHIYRETVPVVIEKYRDEQMHYRRIHNIFQSVIIVGSLGASTVAGLADTPAPYKWILIGVNFSVGASAGFTGYFKFRERSFYLQQTADSIEEELDNFNLRVARYKNLMDDDIALADFTDRVETLKSDQRKRQQQLDQPTETPEG
ncbi:DUF4231 domain-containing protein [Streptomyces sp. ME08-AFT2]|uniref:SLATT domain-containing protein n=1 Tax=Streptomyces sp. ME08-AFT2 TaxID=3028683 RepID=UPI0029A40DE3|nr:DUF4231 domain-containing protein [Streptomyces sp. ME08-AFT2]MDX3313968.1 DUF4231 domain-containing protein [Streptomyces sp. ME08-AFT2]